MRTRWPRLLAALLGLVWFLQIGGGPTLDPRNVRWIPATDWMQHWLGWLMFRHEPWTFPLGTISAMPYPVGTTTGFTDANPIVSLLLKPFSGLMPPEIQFIGPWLALCFMLQGYMGALLASAVTDDEGQQVLAGYLFVLSPVLAARIGHDTLCAHWLLLFLMFLGVREYLDATAARRAIWLGAGAVVVAAGIHPYLTAMCWLLAQALFVRLWRARLVTPGRAAAAAVATTTGMLAVFGAFGYFGGANIAADGFSAYTADLLTLGNPEGFSHLAQWLPRLNLPWEGFGYLGLGGLGACAVAIAAFVRTRPSLRRGMWATIAACVLMGVYSLSADVRMDGARVLSLDWLYAPFAWLIGPFRASGRFIWPLHYLALTFGVWGATRVAGANRRAAATAVLAVAVALQAADLRVAVWYGTNPFRRATVSSFELATGRYDHLALYPMQVLGVSGVPYEAEHVYRYMLLAYQLKMTYNSGIFARRPAIRIGAECVRLQQAVEAGRLDPRTLYVVSSGSVSLFRKAGAACGRFDGDWFCASRDSDEVFRTYLETGKVVRGG